jgi:hypothetical protein
MKNPKSTLLLAGLSAAIVALAVSTQPGVSQSTLPLLPQPLGTPATNQARTLRPTGVSRPTGVFQTNAPPVFQQHFSEVDLRLGTNEVSAPIAMPVTDRAVHMLWTIRFDDGETHVLDVQTLYNTSPNTPFTFQIWFANDPFASLNFNNQLLISDGGNGTFTVQNNNVNQVAASIHITMWF